MAIAADPAAANAKPNASKSATTMRADKDMQEVLNAHAGLKPKPIEKITPAEARQQPTPADAVNVVLKKQGKSTDPESLVPRLNK